MRIKALALVLCFTFLAGAAWAKNGGGIVTYTVNLETGGKAKTARLWLPYPLSDGNQAITDVQVSGNYQASGVYHDPASGANYLFADWKEVTAQPHLTMSFHVDSHYAKLPALKDSKDPFPAEALKYLESSEFIPAASDEFKQIAAEATKGKKGLLAKARGVYDWVVEHTFRDPDVKGCGLGSASRTLNDCKGGGKCADISAVFVAALRAAGIPARDVYGLRLADPKTGDITSGYHCWAEFYLPGAGWVPADPADVRKMMLVHKLELGDPQTKEWREFFWGGDDLFRIVLNRDSRGVVFSPKQEGLDVAYFMYPFAQVDGGTLNYFDPKGFSYSVGFTAD